MIIEVPELYGGFALVGRLGSWDMVLASGLDTGFDAMIALAGSNVVELVRLGEDWPEMDNPADPTAINGWLADQGLPAIVPSTNRDLVEQVGSLFMDGFTVQSVYVA